MIIRSARSIGFLIRVSQRAGTFHPRLRIRIPKLSHSFTDPIQCYDIPTNSVEEPTLKIAAHDEQLFSIGRPTNVGIVARDFLALNQFRRIVFVGVEFV